MTSPSWWGWSSSTATRSRPCGACLAERGTLCSRDFDAADRRAIVSYRGTKDSSLVLYYLWLVGDTMTHHRDGFERVYAPTDAVAPAHLISEAGEADTDRFMARKAVAFAGIGKPGPLSRTLARRVTRDEERAIEHALVESGELVPVEVEGWSGRHFVVGDDAELLRDVASGRVPARVDAGRDHDRRRSRALVAARPGARTTTGQDVVRLRLRVGDLQEAGAGQVRSLRDAHPLGRPFRRAHRPQDRSPVEDARRQRRLARRPTLARSAEFRTRSRRGCNDCSSSSTPTGSTRPPSTDAPCDGAITSLNVRRSARRG